MRIGAIFDESLTKYRYSLTREWDSRLPRLLLCMINPSVATEVKDDPTIRKVITFAKMHGFGSFVVVNLFAMISTDPKVLKNNNDAIGVDNDSYIRLLLDDCQSIWIAWGANAKRFPNRVSEVLTILKEGDMDIYCLGKTKDGHPCHPLMLSYNTQLEVYWQRNSV